jgi:hypothetical protein
MTQESEPKGFFITPVQIFIAYAEKRENEEALPRTQGYYEKRWRLIAGLFDIPFDLGTDDGLHKEGGFRLLDALLNCRTRASRMVPYPILEKGEWPILDKEIYVSHQRSLSKKEEAIRYEYEQMGGELFEDIFPRIGEKHVSVSRLFELGLPLAPPDSQQEQCDWINEHWDDEEFDKPSPPIPKDDMTPKQMDELKLSEENNLKTERRIADEMDQIRRRVIELGIATQENVDEIIYEMPVAQYLDLAADFQKISRVHFNPASLKSQSK